MNETSSETKTHKGSASKDVKSSKTAASMTEPRMQVYRQPVDAGERFVKKVHLTDPGISIAWFFQEEYLYDINFSVLIQSRDCKETRSIKPLSKCITNKGSFTCNEPCQITFIWDNQFSYFRQKFILYTINLTFPDGSTLRINQ